VIRDASLSAVRTYARALAAGAERSPLKRYFDRFDATNAGKSVDDETRAAVDAAVKDAEKRTGARAAKKLTTVGEDGRLSFVEIPPTMTHVSPAIEQRVSEFLSEYILSANVDIRVLMQKYAVSDVARRVVGVGSVGTRCYLVSMQDGDGNVLLLQAKEAGDSVLVEHGGAEQPENFHRYLDRYGNGGRVVAMQRILQAVSDPFLGHVRGVPAEGGPERAFYVRQFHDKKGGFDTDTLEDSAFRWYAEACAATLARAHGQTPGNAVVSGYIGGGRVAGEAILEWAYDYAALSRADWQLFRERRGVA
jgi:hypothetical protein